MVAGVELSEADARIWKRYRIMKTMHWSYREYQNTPARVVDEVWAMIITEAKGREKPE